MRLPTVQFLYVSPDEPFEHRLSGRRLSRRPRVPFMPGAPRAARRRRSPSSAPPEGQGALDRVFDANGTTLCLLRQPSCTRRAGFVLDECELHRVFDVVAPDLGGWWRERLPPMRGVAFVERAPDSARDVLAASALRSAAVAFSDATSDNLLCAFAQTN